MLFDTRTVEFSHVKVSDVLEKLAPSAVVSSEPEIKENPTGKVMLTWVIFSQLFVIVKLNFQFVEDCWQTPLSSEAFQL